MHHPKVCLYCKGARFWTQKWGHNTKISSPASKFVAPILGPFCLLQRVRCAATGCIIHVFLRLVPGCWFHSITDMCCCQLASAVVHLPPVLASSCLCFVAPKQGPDSGPQNVATILKLVAQLINFGPVLPSAKSVLGCDRLHLPFMFSRAWCQDAGFTCRVRSEGRQKACRPTAPKMARVAAQAKKERFKRCRDARAVLQQA